MYFFVLSDSTSHFSLSFRFLFFFFFFSSLLVCDFHDFWTGPVSLLSHIKKFSTHFFFLIFSFSFFFLSLFSGSPLSFYYPYFSYFQPVFFSFYLHFFTCTFSIFFSPTFCFPLFLSSFTFFSCFSSGSVSWAKRIHRLHLCRGVRHPQRGSRRLSCRVLQNTPIASLQRGKTSNEGPRYSTKQSDGEPQVILELLVDEDYIFIAIVPRSTLTWSGNIW